MRDAEPLKTMDGMKYIASVPDDEDIVAMVEHEGTLFVASDKHLYILADRKRLERID